MSRPKMSREEYLARLAIHQKYRSAAYLQFAGRNAATITDVIMKATERLDQKLVAPFVGEMLVSIAGLLTKTNDNDARVVCEAINELITRMERNYELEITDGWLERDPRS
jgi:hypothetical protein